MATGICSGHYFLIAVNFKVKIVFLRQGALFVDGLTFEQSKTGLKFAAETHFFYVSFTRTQLLNAYLLRVAYCNKTYAKPFSKIPDAPCH